MKVLRPFFLITIFLTAACSADTPAPAPSPPANATEFIRTSCQTTLYPDLCYHSLSGYASAVQQDPARLAGAAVWVSLTRASGTAIYLVGLSRQVSSGGDPRAAGALRDCLSVFGDAVEQMRGSLKQMRRLAGSRGGDELRFEMSNVQTWMSAALTNEDTCTEGFKGVADGPVKMDVCERAAKVAEVTSNALALVNSYVSKIMIIP